MPYVPQGAESTPVRCCKLDTYVASTGCIPHIVIRDVEHAEGRVLRGMQSVLKEHRPCLLIEMHGPEAIREAFGEIVTAEYRLAKLPKLEPVKDVNEISLLGHYLGIPSSQRIVPR
jgi:hypothetical protein